MGRPEKALDPVGGPVQEFADHLRTLRRGCGFPTYSALARRTGISASTLCTAAGGSRLPRLPVALAYARACGGDPRETLDRWTSARSSLTGSGARAEDGAVVLGRIHSPADLVRELRTLLAARELSLRRLAGATAAAGRPVSRSTMSDLLRGDRMPSPEVLDVVLVCCGEPRPVREQWRAVLERVDAVGRRPPQAAVRPPQDLPAVALAAELSRLRGGRGVQSANLAERLGPELRRTLGLAPDAAQAVVRPLLVAALTREVGVLPPESRIPVQVALALHPDCRFNFEHERIRWLADRVDRHPRTVQRQVRSGLGLLAGRLSEQRRRAAQQERAFGGGDEVWIR